jgi:hypothetical protein
MDRISAVQIDGDRPRRQSIRICTPVRGSARRQLAGIALMTKRREIIETPIIQLLRASVASIIPDAGARRRPR